MRMRVGLVYLLFFLSGISALVYQVIWVRQFGTVFGNTVYSASIVTAVFMCGLGVGSFVAGRWADRRYRRSPDSMLRAYACFEIGIALTGTLIAAVLPQLEPLSASLSRYVTTGNGWLALSFTSQLVPYLIALALLAPITTLMGGTLSLLIRHLIRSDLSVTGRRVGSLYGLNTAGAAVGAFLVDFSLVPSIGLSGAQTVAVAINLGVGITAWWWAAGFKRFSTENDDTIFFPSSNQNSPYPSPPSRSPNESSAVRVTRATGVAILLSGFSGMGLEILWFRYLISVLGSNRATFSLLLTVILAGMWLGAMLCNRVQRRLGNPAIIYLGAQSLIAVSALVSFYLFDPASLPVLSLHGSYVGAPAVLRPLIEVWAKLRIIIAVVGFPAFLMGFAYPLANSCVQRAEASVGSRAGALYLANTVGAVAGAVVTGFFLLPAIGMQSTLHALAVCSLATALPLEISLRGERAGRWQVLTGRCLVGLAGACLLICTLLPADLLTTRLYRPQNDTERLICLSEGISETIWITGASATNDRYLYTNGHPMSGTSYEGQRYMRAFVHIPMMQMEHARDVLVICFGVGNTAHAASLYPSVRRIDIVDLSRHVLEHASFFSAWNHGVISDPRVAVHVNDGRQHLRMQPPASYDLITLEPPPISQAGVASLYSKEFYELARERLKPGAFLTQWFPAYQVPGAVCSAIVGAFVAVFPDAIMLSGFKSEFILMGRKGAAPQISPEAIFDHLRRLPAVRADLQAIDLGSATEIIGSFAGSARSLASVARLASPVTDDFPIMEYSKVTFREASIPIRLFAVDDVAQWCPACVSQGDVVNEITALPLYLEALNGYYTNLDNQPPQGRQLRPIVQLGLDEATFSELQRRFGYLSWLYGSP